MLLTIRTTHRPATDVGFLLHKHPDHVHTRDFPFGNATVFYPEATEDACTAAVLLTVDPVGRRLDAVFEVLKTSGASRVLDLGCGEGRLLHRLLADHQFTDIAGMDVAGRALDLAESRLTLDRLAPKQRERIRLVHGSLMYRDSSAADRRQGTGSRPVTPARTSSAG